MSGASTNTWQRLQQEVVNEGICTHCGACAGLSHGTLQMCETAAGPVPIAHGGVDLPALAYDACPGKGIDYPAATQALFGRLPDNWLLGCYRRLYIGRATSPDIRRRAASGGVISQTLIYLLQKGLIDGAVVLQQGQPRPWQAQPVIARTPEVIIAAAQSVYVPAPVNTILPQMEAFDGRLAYVGLPDQVASLRTLQQAGHEGATKVDYVLGPYVGTSMYLGAIESFLRANGVKSLAQVASLRYREGEWPGHLQITLHDGRVLRARKFYYNYLIPFYITQASLQAVDFSNELTDISVGDAWSPQYEKRGEGYSVVVARSERAEAVLRQMVREGFLALDETTAEEAMAMHGHMLDFKKRGAFIRNEWRQRAGRRAPTYGYRPASIPLTRKLVELFIVLLFSVCRTRVARQLVQWMPLSLIGPLFDVLRRSWKAASKPVKRKGLGNASFVIAPATTPEIGTWQGERA